jgi:hypothetical protein
MDYGDTLTILVTAVAAVIALRTMYVAARAVIYDRVERALLSIDATFITYPSQRPFFYDGDEFSGSVEERQRCLAIAEYVLDVFGSVIEQRERFSGFADRHDFEQLISDMFSTSPMLNWHLNHGYKAPPERIAQLKRYAAPTARSPAE